MIKRVKLKLYKSILPDRGETREEKKKKKLEEKTKRNKIKRRLHK